MSWNALTVQKCSIALPSNINSAAEGKMHHQSDGCQFINLPLTKLLSKQLQLSATHQTWSCIFTADTYNNWSVLDGHNARHSINNPLRIDHYVRLQKLILEMLHGAKIMQELNSLSNLQVYTHVCDNTIENRFNSRHTMNVYNTMIS